MIAEETEKEKEAEPERIIISEDLVKKNMPPPFPQALRSKKKIPNLAEIWEVLRQVKVNIPLLDMIKQVPMMSAQNTQVIPVSVFHFSRYFIFKYVVFVARYLN